METIAMSVDEIVNNKALMEGIDNLNLGLEPSIEEWIFSNGIRVYKTLTIDVVIDANFECFYHFGVKYEDVGDYYKLILPDDLVKLYDGLSEDFFKVYKNDMKHRLKSGCGFIIKTNNETYYVCIDEN